MTTPYIERLAGDFIVAKDWNDMQVQIREHIQKHTHAGAGQGTPIDGSGINPDAVVTVGELTVKRTLKIDARLGIGTTEPAAKLSFNNVDDGSDGADGITWYNPNPTQYGIHRTAGSWSAPDFQQLRLGWATGIVLDPGTQFGKSYVDVQGNGLRVTAGRLGIGQSAPDAPLHIEGGADAALNRSGYLVIGPVAGANLNIDNNEIMARNNGEASTLHVQTRGGDLIVHGQQPETTQFVVKNDGKVGIGENNPTTQLSLGRPVQARMLALHDNPNGWYGFGIQSGQMRLQIGNTRARFAFLAGDQSEVMTVRGNGNLTVAGSINGGGAMITRVNQTEANTRRTTTSTSYRDYWGPFTFTTTGGRLLILFDVNFAGNDTDDTRTWMRILVDNRTVRGANISWGRAGIATGIR